MRKQVFTLVLLGLLCSVGNVWGVTFTYSGSSGYDAATGSGTTRDNITVVFSGGSHSNSGGGYWNVSGQNTTITITSTSTNISSVSITHSDGSRSKTMSVKTGSGNITGTAGTDAILTYSNSSAESNIVLNYDVSGARVTSIEVTTSGGGGGDDETAPTLSSSTPANGATDVAKSGTIVLTFSEAIASVDATKFALTGATKGGVAVDGTDSKKVNVAYSGAASGATVTLSVTAEAVADAAGNKSAALEDISFTATTVDVSNVTETIILNDVYDASATTTGYSKHAAITWGGTTSSNSRTAGDPNNNGAATSGNVACYNAKGNGGGKNITISITGCDKIIVYHESNASRYLQIKNGEDIIATGTKSTYYTEATLSRGTEYSLLLTGTDGSKNQDFYVYAIKLHVHHVTATIGSTGWTTFSSNVPLDLSTISGGTAYYASAVFENAVTLTKSTDKVAVGEGLMINGNPDATFTINTTADDATLSSEDNYLVGVPTSTSVAASTSGANHYVFGYESSSVYGFYNLTAATTIPAGKAYLETEDALTSQGNAPAIIRILDEENNATSIESIDGKNDAIKFIENGQLYILREGVIYDALGRKVR